MIDWGESAGGDSAAGKATLKAHRAKLADLVKPWYDFVRENDGEYFDKELWDRKNKIYTKDTLTKDQKAKEALDFLPPANINRLFVAGHSRGGHG